MKEHYHGFNFKTIPRNVINFKGDLENGDIIENDNKIALIWSSHDEGYKLITDNAYVFIDKDELKTKWRKIE
jgi:hypothetical protein